MTKDRIGSSRKDDSERWKGPYIPSRASTPAALTAKLRSDHSECIEEPRAEAGRGARDCPPAEPSPPPPCPVQEAHPAPRTTTRCRKSCRTTCKLSGVGRNDYELVKTTSCEYAIRARVPNQTGTTSYQELGPTAAAAVQRLIDQLRIDPCANHTIVTRLTFKPPAVSLASVPAAKCCPGRSRHTPFGQLLRMVSPCLNQFHAPSAVGFMFGMEYDV